jgi:hypothetical protein
MCVDYTSLNKACPKDLFPLPHIDQDIDLMAGCELHSSFLCYVKVSFKLKNVRATYQRCMQFCFKEQIGRNLEVYIDDIVIKS